MATFGKSSAEKLETAHEDLQTLFNEVVKYFDCTILCGFRNKQDQDEAYEKGFSKVKWPNGKHNKTPSMAVDAVPYPIDWNDTARMKYFAGFVKGIAAILKDQGKITHTVVSGIDWNNNTELKDTNFFDHPHFELKEKI